MSRTPATRSAPAPAEVESYLHKHIPLSADMGVTVTACSYAEVTLRVPLGPNINHHATVFGGSASAVAILAGWTWLYFALRSVRHTAQLVIQRNTVDYVAPITGEFEAHCAGLPANQFEEFLATLDRYGKARANLDVNLTCAGKRVAAFSGSYVAVRGK